MAAIAVAVCPAGCREAPRVIAKPVTFAAADGKTIHATLYTPAAESPPALLLLHMIGSDRHAWDSFARTAATAGYMVLAIDLRGYGDAAAEAPGAARDPDAFPADAILGQDLGPSIDYLIDNGADPENLVIGGASIGANLALRYAGTDPRIQAAVLLSPGEEYRGVTVLPELAAYAQRPLMILAAEGDNYSAATARKMKNEAKNYCELRLYPGSAHGTSILNTSGEAAGQILLWLEPITGPNPPDPVEVRP